MVAASVGMLLMGMLAAHPIGRLVAFTVAYGGLVATSYYQIKVFVPNEHPDLPLPACCKKAAIVTPLVKPHATRNTIDMARALRISFQGEENVTNRAISLAGLRHFIRKHNITGDMPTWQVVEEHIKPATEAEATAYTALLKVKCEARRSPLRIESLKYVNKVLDLPPSLQSVNIPFARILFA